MAFFADLTAYTYLQPEEETPNTLNIGWLEPEYPFAAGETSDEFRVKLGRICLIRVKRARGSQRCRFCKGRDKPGGSAEIRVPGDGCVYAAPEMVHHYVVAHGYKPPEGFITAVLTWDDNPT